MPDTGLTRPTDPSRTQQSARILVGAVFVALGAYTLQSFLSALAWAAILAIAIWPLFLRVEARWPPGPHRLLVPSLFTLAVALIFVVPLALVALQLVREAHGIGLLVRDAQENGIPVPDAVNHLPFSAQITQWWQANLAQKSGPGDLFGRVNRGQLMDLGRDVGRSVLHRIVLFGFTLLTLFFLFRDGDHLVDSMLVASRRALGPRGERIGRQIVASVRGTVSGLVLVGLGEGVLIGAAYAIGGVPHPVLLGAATGVAAMIPFGAPLVFGLVSVYLLAQGAVGWAIGIFVFGFVVGFIADHFIRPALIGGTTKLPFVWVLLGILGGVEVWGLLGLFLGPAIMAALILLWREWTAPSGVDSAAT